jgi:hypothetical protein
VSPTSAARGGYAQEVDDLFRALDAEDGRPAPTQAKAPGQPNRQVIYTIAPVSPEIAAAEMQEAQQRAYDENLTGCLDGRFPAFCDHAQLTPYDAARVQRAEYEANLATCLDPEWQHLCRPELLPPSYGSEVSAPVPPEAGIAPATHVQPAAIQAPAPTWRPVVAPPPNHVHGCSESGSCYGDISTLTGRPKTTYVRGYFRRNGTYVRSYYRGRGRR